ncbi:MAG: type-F conjugative transfer system pilin assembly protein TrbC [Rickettsiales bacterium]
MEKKKLLYWLTTLIAFSVTEANAEKLETIVNQVRDNIAKSSSQYTEVVKEHEEKIEDQREFYKDLVKKANVAIKGHALEIDKDKSVTIYKKGGIVQQIVKNHKLDLTPKINTGLLIFVSFTMPKEMLWSYMEQAITHNARLVIRGLVDNSFKKTIKAMQLDNNRKLIVDVNPKAFAEYKVNQVPAIVLSNKETYDKFTGSISIKHALEEIRNSGDLKNHKLVGGKK